MPHSDLSHLGPSIELRNVSFRYAEGETWVLKGVSFMVEAGEAVVVTGQSGAGKTTLQKMTEIRQALPPDGG